MRFIFLSLGFLFLSGISAQNLVINPGFENGTPQTPQHICQHLKADQFNDWLADWSTFETTTPDYIRVAPDSASCHQIQPHQGQGMIGLYTFHPGMDSGWPEDYHEYVQGQLRTHLQPGETYRVTLWVQLNDSLGGIYLQEAWPYLLNMAPRAANNLGIYFSEFAASPEEHFSQTIRDFNLRPQVNFEEVIALEGQWVQLSATFRANAAYRYFIIGNFYSDFRTSILPDDEREQIDAFNSQPGPRSKKVRRYAYYLIDDVQVGLDQGEPDLAGSLEKQGTFTFREVQFASNQAILKTEGREELDLLADYLRSKPGVIIEIGGHTDAIGSSAANQQLSEERAKAVRDYLTQKGVLESQLQYHGYGESKPIASNETPSGRAKNRRVECKVVDP